MGVANFSHFKSRNHVLVGADDDRIKSVYGWNWRIWFHIVVTGLVFDRS